MSTTVPGHSTGRLSYLERMFHVQERGSTLAHGDSRRRDYVPHHGVHRICEPGHIERSGHAHPRGGRCYLPVGSHWLHPDGHHCQLSDRPGAGHGPQRVLCVYRRQGNGDSLADCAGMRLPLRLRVFVVDGGRGSPADRECHPPGVICCGGGGGGTLRCLRWLTGCGHHCAQRGDSGGHGQSARARRPLWLASACLRLPCCRRGGCVPRCYWAFSERQRWASRWVSSSGIRFTTAWRT